MTVAVPIPNALPSPPRTISHLQNLSIDSPISSRNKDSSYLTMAPHPLQQLSVAEAIKAKEILISEHDKDEVLIIREIFLQEPPKVELQKFLQLEHSGSLTESSPRPARQAACQYDVVGSDKIPYFHESVIDIEKGVRTKHEVIGKEQHAPLKL